MSRSTDRSGEPLPQRALDSIWLLAGAAILFWLLSYVVWGMIEILAAGGG